MKEKTKDLLREEKLKFFIQMYKNFDLKIEECETTSGFDLSNINIAKIDDLWGKDKPEKLRNLKNYMGRKRKKQAD